MESLTLQVTRRAHIREVGKGLLPIFFVWTLLMGLILRRGGGGGLKTMGGGEGGMQNTRPK